ncbi:P-loop containing nucleoside triphosphate hydrolase protein [Armillaria solidipes]|uniref:P-loop containing nucleoside triphosphate hydrolase protein n=1 Tax=Armillaria solidipes TaxID=1076256 RepID=A0A2H3BRM0_9AGAR|nr:P-loop containing nucleoside triphosphate hydrolase protein [Armillaria solidipes]
MAHRRKSSTKGAIKPDATQKTLFDLFPKKLKGTQKPTTAQPDIPELNNDEEGADVINGVEQPASRPARFNEVELVPIPPISSSPIPFDIVDTIVDLSDTDMEPASSQSTARPLKPSLSFGGSQQDPIVIESSSPVKPRPIQPYSIFAPRPKRAATPASPRKADTKLLDAPYPSSDTQHVRGPQTTYQATPSQTPQLLLQAQSVNKSEHMISLDRASHLAELPQSHRDHPAISRLSSNSTVATQNQKLWTDQYRPTCADEVLGNEQNARYLRDWLRALQLELKDPPASTQSSQSSTPQTKSAAAKRPHVTRRVSKRRGRKKQRIDSDEEDNWIVYSEDDFFYPASEDEQVNGLTRLKRKSRFEDEYVPPSSPPPASTQPLFTDLTNTIVLAGPSGSGKSAAVYACAAEMGWEVFEVYPGIGKRNASNLDNLVGEVGKNHLVRKARREEDRDGHAHAKEKLAAMLCGRKSAPEHTWTEPTDAGPSNRPVNQSLVLLEEVDILFKEDTNFWPAVTNFIKDCKRPVICTCNDITLLPLDDLPLQQILHFRPCESSLATSYLQSMCAAEGYLVDRKKIAQVYERSPEHHDVIPDLRQSIHTLQLWCPGYGVESNWPLHHQPFTHEESTSSSQFFLSLGEPLSPNGFVARHAESLSFLDSHLRRHDEDMPEAIAFSQAQVSGDDEVGHTILFNTRDSITRQDSYGDGDQDRTIMSTAIRLSRGGIFGSMRSTNLSAHAGYRDVIKMLGRNVMGAQALRGTAFDVDYLPWIRQIVLADDEEEKSVNKAEIRVGRRTRNSQGQRYVRAIEISEDEREALEQTALGGPDG